VRIISLYVCFISGLCTRTRGGSSQPEVRKRPTASVRRGDRRDGARPAIVQNVPPHADAVGFPGGPFDPSVLVSYADHIGYRL